MTSNQGQAFPATKSPRDCHESKSLCWLLRNRLGAKTLSRLCRSMPCQPLFGTPSSLPGSAAHRTRTARKAGPVFYSGNHCNHNYSSCYGSFRTQSYSHMVVSTVVSLSKLCVLEYMSTTRRQKNQSSVGATGTLSCRC